MDLKDRDQGNSRSKEWLDFTKDFCERKGEDIVDLLAFNLRRTLLEQGEKNKAESLEKVLRGERTLCDPFSPRTTWARSVVSGRSSNQLQDDFKFGKQKKQQTYATPDQIELEKFQIIAFKLSHGDEIFEYKPPSKPKKPIFTPGWSRLSSEETK